MKFIITLLILSFSVNYAIGQDIVDYDKLYEKYDNFIHPIFLDTQSVSNLILLKFQYNIFTA
jgi:hypothetical protein